MSEADIVKLNKNNYDYLRQIATITKEISFVELLVKFLNEIKHKHKFCNELFFFCLLTLKVIT